MTAKPLSSHARKTWVILFSVMLGTSLQLSCQKSASSSAGAGGGVGGTTTAEEEVELEVSGTIDPTDFVQAQDSVEIGGVNLTTAGKYAISAFYLSTLGKKVPVYQGASDTERFSFKSKVPKRYLTIDVTRQSDGYRLGAFLPPALRSKLAKLRLNRASSIAAKMANIVADKAVAGDEAALKALATNSISVADTLVLAQSVARVITEQETQNKGSSVDLAALTAKLIEKSNDKIVALQGEGQSAGVVAEKISEKTYETVFSGDAEATSPGVLAYRTNHDLGTSTVAKRDVAYEAIKDLSGDSTKYVDAAFRVEANAFRSASGLSDAVAAENSVATTYSTKFSECYAGNSNCAPAGYTPPAPPSSSSTGSGGISGGSSSGSGTNTGSVATPTAAPAAGIYTTAQLITLSSTTNGARIYYTVDGSPPTESSNLYAEPIAVLVTQTIKAISIKSDLSASSVRSFQYTITGTVQAPTFSVPGGIYGPSQSVALSSSTPGADIYYTVNGDTPTKQSIKYSSPIAVSSSQTIKSIAALTNWADSQVSSSSYTINGPVAMPQFSVSPGTYTSQQSVAIISATPGAAIYYTVDGGTPSSSSNQYVGAINIETTQTIKAIAVKSGFSDSAVAEGRYTINIPGSVACTASSANGGSALNNYFNFSSVSTVNVQNDFVRIGSSHTDAGVTYSKDLPAGTAGIQMMFRQNISLGSNSGPYIWFTLNSTDTQAAAYGLLVMYFPNLSSLNPYAAPNGWGDYNNVVFYVYDYATQQYGPKIDTEISRLDANNINYNVSIDKPILSGNLKITINDSSFNFADDRFTNTYISSISGVPLNMWWNTNYNFDIYSFASSCGSNSAANTAEAPGAPSAVSGAIGDAQVSLAWSAPASNGGASITDYIIQYSSNAGSSWATFNDATSTSSSAVITGLTNGTSYLFRVAAVNSAGTGIYSAASNSVTLVANYGNASFSGSGSPGDPWIPNTPQLSCQGIRSQISASPFGNAWSSSEGIGQDGIYQITVNSETLSVYCDMTRDGGGWTRVVGINANNLNHSNVSVVAWTNADPTSDGKLSDAQINAIKNSNSSTTPVYRLMSGDKTAYFPGSCVFNSSALAASGDCLKFSASFSSPVWLTAMAGDAVNGCGINSAYATLSAVKLSSYCGPQSTDSVGLHYRRVDWRGTSYDSGMGSGAGSGTLYVRGGTSAPNAPNNIFGTAGTGQVSLTWATPASDGGSAIADYVIQYSSNGGASWTTFNDGTSSSTSAVVTGLTNDVPYIFKVAATNSAGTGAYSSNSSSLSPSADGGSTVPGAPTGLTGSPHGHDSFWVNWTAPVNNGGSAITSYVIEYTKSGATQTLDTNSTNTERIVYVGYGPEKEVCPEYAVRVAAKNEAGTGAYSSSTSISICP
jgi:hypothetical protein